MLRSVEASALRWDSELMLAEQLARALESAAALVLLSAWDRVSQTAKGSRSAWQKAGKSEAVRQSVLLMVRELAPVWESQPLSARVRELK